MRIALVTHYFPSHRGGVEIVAGELAARLAQRGHSVHWLASDVSEPPPPVPRLKAEEAPAWNIVEDRLHLPVPVWKPGATRRLRRALGGADLLHVHDYLYHGNVLALRLAHKRRIPIVITQHIARVPYRSALARAAFSLAERTVGRAALRRADRAVFVSDRVARHFARVNRTCQSRVIRNGVDLERFHPVSPAERSRIRAELGLEPDRPALLFAGRFVEKKGLHVLSAVADAVREVNWVFGGWGPLDPSSWGYSHVRVLGRLDQDRLAPWYQAADLLVLPSVGEGFPLVVQEAMACGTPALVTRETAEGCEAAIPHLVVVPGLEPEVWNETIRAFLARRDHPARREETARAARQLWSWERAVDDYEQMFRELCSAQRSAEHAADIVTTAVRSH